MSSGPTESEVVVGGWVGTVQLDVAVAVPGCTQPGGVVDTPLKEAGDLAGTFLVWNLPLELFER